MRTQLAAVSAWQHSQLSSSCFQVQLLLPADFSPGMLLVLLWEKSSEALEPKYVVWGGTQLTRTG